jgi:hypothetical protein
MGREGGYGEMIMSDPNCRKEFMAWGIDLFDKFHNLVEKQGYFVSMSLAYSTGDVSLYLNFKVADPAANRGRDVLNISITEWGYYDDVETFNRYAACLVKLYLQMYDEPWVSLISGAIDDETFLG